MRLFILIALCIALGTSSDDVVELTSVNFQQEVLETKVPYLVEFYAPWCGHCKNLAPTYEAIGKHLKGIINVGKMDAEKEAKIAHGDYKVKGYPQMKLFMPGESTPKDYNSAQRSAKAIIDWAVNFLSIMVHGISDVEKLDKFWRTRPDIPHALLFTTKSKTSPTLRSLATRYEKRIEFGEIMQGTDVAGTLGEVEKYPELRVYENRDAEPTIYEGVMKATQLVEFLEQFAGEESKQRAQPKERPAPTKGQTIIQLESEEDFVDKCGKICAVGIYSAESEDDAATMAKLHEAFKSGGKFEFLHLDAALATEVPEKFGVSAPGLFVYKSKRKRFSVASEFTYDTLHGHLDNVLTGDAKFTNLKSE